MILSLPFNYIIVLLSHEVEIHRFISKLFVSLKTISFEESTMEINIQSF